MALPASDNFNRSNGALGSDWTGTSGSLVINSNSVASNSSGAETAAGWNADAFANNQYSQVKITATTTGGAVGPAVRVSLSGNVNYYGYYGSSSENSSGVFKVVNGSWFDLSGAISGAGFAVNDVVRLEVEGTALRAYKNSTLVWSGTDSDISSGAAGICGYSNVSGMRLDDWTGGDLGGSGATVNATAGGATAAGIAPAVSAGSAVTASVGAASAAAPAATISGGSTISATTGAATAAGIAAAVSAGASVAATARAWAPGVQSGTGTTPAARVWQVGRELRRWAVEQERRTSMERNEGRVYW